MADFTILEDSLALTIDGCYNGITPFVFNIQTNVFPVALIQLFRCIQSSLIIDIAAINKHKRHDPALFRISRRYSGVTASVFRTETFSIDAIGILCRIAARRGRKHGGGRAHFIYVDSVVLQKSREYAL